MRYVTDIPKEDPRQIKELENQGWTLVKEPKHLIISILLSLPFAFIGGYLGVIAFPDVHAYMNEIFYKLTSDQDFMIWIDFQYLIDMYGYIVLHELIHVAFVPNFWKSDKTYFTVHLWGGMMNTEEELSKSRFIVISIMPYLLLTFALPALLIWGGLPISLITFLIVVNGFGSCMDLFGICLIVYQVPNGAIIRNVGMKTLYKL